VRARGRGSMRNCLLAQSDHGLQVTLIDPDTVSETNCVRQPFCRTEIGFPKAIVLTHRINLFWGLDWEGTQAQIQQVARSAGVDFVIGCVDTRKARRAIDKWTHKARVMYWLDLGNDARSGQFVLGQPNNQPNRRKNIGCRRLGSSTQKSYRRGRRISHLAARPKR
jgi:PRTRC genetic system ThiF family protein